MTLSKPDFGANFETFTCQTRSNSLHGKRAKTFFLPKPTFTIEESLTTPPVKPALLHWRLGHLFWECTVTKEVWNLSDIPLDQIGINHRDFMDLLWYSVFKQHVDTKLVELVITKAWSAWFSRSKACMAVADTFLGS